MGDVWKWEGDFTSLLVLSEGEVSDSRVTILPKSPSSVSPDVKNRSTNLISRGLWLNKGNFYVDFVVSFNIWQTIKKLFVWISSKFIWWTFNCHSFIFQKENLGHQSFFLVILKKNKIPVTFLLSIFATNYLP